MLFESINEIAKKIDFLEKRKDYRKPKLRRSLLKDYISPISFNKKINKEEEKKYLINAYRVLLTRARQGIVVFVSKGDKSDPTRPPSYYNETYDYLLSCGFEEIG